MNPPLPTRRANPTQRLETIVWIAVAALWLYVYGVRFFYYVNVRPDFEQIRNGAFASGLLDGLAAPAKYYRYGIGEGPLVYGAVLAPIFFLGGSKYLWIKLLGGLFAAGGALVWTLALRRVWGFAAAAMFLLWNALPPPFWEWHSHQFWANHFESVFLAGLLLLLFLRAGEARPGFWVSAAAGLFAGFAVVFCLDNLFMAIALAVGFVWRWRRPGLARLVWPTGPVFLLSLAPFLLNSTDELQIHRAWPAQAFERWRDLLFWALPRLTGYHVAGWPALSAAVYVAAVLGIVAAIVAMIRLARRRPGLPAADWLGRALLLHLLVFFVAIGYAKRMLPPPGDFFALRYLLPLVPILTAFVCYLFSRLPGFWKWLPLAPFLAVGLANLKPLAPRDLAYFSGSWRTLTERRGDDYDWMVFDRLPNSWTENPAASPALAVARLPRRWRDDGWAAYGRWLHADKALTSLLGDAAFGGDGRAAIARGAGLDFGDRLFPLGCDEIEGFAEKNADLIALPARLDAPLASAFAEGVGGGMAENCARFDSEFSRNAPDFFRDRLENSALLADRLRCVARFLAARLAQPAPAARQQAFLRGVGQWQGWRQPNLPPESVAGYAAFLASVVAADSPPEATQEFYRGYAEGQAHYLTNDFNYFAFGPPRINLPLLREAFARRGVELQPTGRIAEEFALEIAK
jgi:hypothetical protein